jgi:DNA primase
MPRLVDRPVQVVRAPDGRPQTILLGRRRLAVAARLERWRESGEWWEDEAEREVERLLLADGAVVEVSGPARAGGAGPHRLDTWFD